MREMRFFWDKISARGDTVGDDEYTGDDEDVYQGGDDMSDIRNAPAPSSRKTEARALFKSFLATLHHASDDRVIQQGSLNGTPILGEIKLDANVW